MESFTSDLHCPRYRNVVLDSPFLQPRQLAVPDGVGKLVPVDVLHALSSVGVHLQLPVGSVPRALGHGDETREHHGVEVLLSTYCL